MRTGSDNAQAACNRTRRTGRLSTRRPQANAPTGASGASYRGAINRRNESHQCLVCLVTARATDGIADSNSTSSVANI